MKNILHNIMEKGNRRMRGDRRKSGDRRRKEDSLPLWSRVLVFASAFCLVAGYAIFKR